MNSAIARQRLDSQWIARTREQSPADVVAALGAVQSQEYQAAKWGLGLRMSDGALDADIERAFNDGHILRTHVMRPTWHFVTPYDIRWLLQLTAPRVHRAVASYFRRLELDSATRTRAAAVFERALRDGRCLTRTELGARLGRARIPATGIRLALLMMDAELEGVVCSGPRRGVQHTYALLEERVPKAPVRAGDEALAELARRYFTSHGPATIRDFVWWSGLRTAEARRGLEMNAARHTVLDGVMYWSLDGSRHETRRRGAAVQLLPIYDEYLVAYRDREAVPHWPAGRMATPRGSMPFQHALVIRGQVAGTWRFTRAQDRLAVNVIAGRPLTDAEKRGVVRAASRFERFLDARMSLSIGTST